MSDTEVLLERETANDEEAQVVAIHVQSGTAVQPGDVIFDIENSKATQEVVASQAGVLIHNLKIGDQVAFGIPIARIVPAKSWDGSSIDRGISEKPSLERSSPLTAAPSGHDVARPSIAPSAAQRRVSHAAASLLAKLGLTSAQFGSDFVTAHDVRAYLKEDAGVPNAAPAMAVAVKQAITTAGDPVTSRKRAEIQALTTGAGGMMLSVLGIGLGEMRIPREPDDILSGRITDLVIYEASRLLRKYPRLNAFYQDDRIIKHDAVHAGLAIDGGGRLVVYGIENADRVGLPDLSRIIADAVGRYMNNELSAAELSRATFTVTDLSADDLDFVFPLLPRGQSLILGVTRSAAAGFRLFAGFDHRVTEGREIAAFLGELRGRLASFIAAAAAGATQTAAPASCDFCGRSLADAVHKGKDKGLLKILDREHRDALCCASCWNGW